MIYYVCILFGVVIGMTITCLCVAAGNADRKAEDERRK